MLVIAVTGIIAIGYSTISYKNGQVTSFNKSIIENDSLTISYLRMLVPSDSVQIKDYEGRPVALQFWSSWSEKSLQMQNEMREISHIDSMIVIAASVKDALEDAQVIAREYGNANFIYVDGTTIYNELKTPGIPSYILFDRSGKPVNAKVGYIKGSIRDSLSYYLEDE